MKGKRAMPIKWHINSAKNTKEYLEKERYLAEAALERITKQEKQLEFYQNQIMVAQLRGKESFDSDSFLVPKKKSQ